MTNRPIEFRFWDGKKMRTDFFIDSKGELYQWDSHELDFVGNIKGVQTLRFTGLLDKNGTKIFEGDILRQPWEDESGDHIAILQINDIRDVNGDIEVGNIKGSTAEVIGNIYQNPELLKK